MAELQPLSEDLKAELIAYLDGELDEEEARAVEARINRDPRVRAEVEALRRSWGLLDYLPKPEPSPQFTQRTVTRASVLAPSLLDRARRWRRLVFGVSWAAALVVAGVVGYASVPAPREKPAEAKAEDQEQQLVRDLRVIDQLPALQNAGDINFLYELDRPELFGDDPAGK
jgi:anti-sigma factor RsiW